ncbi:MAG: M6 family metalloprotease domain-containing protein [Candidatus Latescibacterota bacterium]|nr:MAG: M6 family metalloprotease domain-containing protein [Candidatus Latescibacterota bacterium]
MCRHPTTQGVFAVCLATVVLFHLALTLASPKANAIPPGPESRDREVGSSTITSYPPPVFPEWFGKGLRPLQAMAGEGRVVALLIDFPDRPANRVARPGSFFNDLLFSQGTHPTGSFRDFYLEQSYGIFDVTGEAYGWLRTAEDYATTYDDGNYGFAGGARGVFVSAVLLADPTVDFGTFDSDSPDGIPNSGDDDGYVDACLIYVSGLGGHDTYNPSDIWPHATGIDPPIETNDPRAGGGYILVEGYSMQPEINLNAAGTDTLDSCLGVVTHEYGHQLGLPDLYDGAHETWGIGYWGLMGYGSLGALRTGPYHLSAWSKVALGWVTPTVVEENLLDLTIPPVETDPVIYKVWRDGIPGDEYFLLENRQPLGFDTFLPGHGLLIWHVDETMFPTHGSPPGEKTPTEGWFRVALEQADGLNHLATWFERPDKRAYYYEMGDGADPYPGDSLNTSFDDYSNPSSKDNSGVKTEVSIVDITVEGNDIHLSIVIDSSTVAVYFNEFRAHLIEAGVELTWDVFSDEPIAGFRLHRREAGSDRETSIPGYGLIPREERRYIDSDVRPGKSYRYALGAVSPDGSELRSHSVEVSLKPLAFVLHQNYPNPFNPKTTISFSLPKETWVNLSVFDVEGRLVRTLENKTLSGGFKEVEWDGKDWRGNPVSSGVYLYRLMAGKRVIAKKMVLLR